MRPLSAHPPQSQVNYPNVSTQKLALQGLKRRVRELESEVKQYDEEIERLRTKDSDNKTVDELASELR